MFVKKHCSPRKDKINISCLSKSLLIKIAKVLNKKYGAKIKIKKQSKKKLYDAIKNKLKTKECKSELCWKNIDQISNALNEKEKKEFKNSFRPLRPQTWEKNPNTWLNTTDINNVMEQYEKKYPYFQYYGATPIDFNLKYGDSCMVSDLCKINLNNLNNKECIGMVFNTDKHDEPGQHWFSMYIDNVGKNMPNPAIYYFDSATSVQKMEELPAQILQLMEKLQEQSNYKFDIYYNDIKHQRGSTECGIYCLYFLTEMLKGISFKKLIQRNLTDRKIEKYRNIFFIDNKII